MTLKKLILILLASAIRTASLAQCDSAISVCPNAFDYLISQDLKEQKCRAENISLRAQNTNLNFQLKESAFVLEKTSTILMTTNQEKELLYETIILKDRTIKKQAGQIAGLKIGCFTIGVAGVVSTVYFIFR